MTIVQYHAVMAAMADCADREDFISEAALSTIWGDPLEAEIPAERIELLGTLWDTAHRSIKEIAAAAGLSNRKLAERFGIPYSTMEDWSAGARKCNPYIRMMMQECLGLLRIDLSVK